MKRFHVIVQNQEDQVWDRIRDNKEQALYKITEDMGKCDINPVMVKQVHTKLIFGKYDQAVALMEKEGFTVTVKELSQ